MVGCDSVTYACGGHGSSSWVSRLRSPIGSSLRQIGVVWPVGRRVGGLCGDFCCCRSGRVCPMWSWLKRLMIEPPFAGFAALPGMRRRLSGRPSCGSGDCWWRTGSTASCSRLSPRSSERRRSRSRPARWWRPPSSLLQLRRMMMRAGQSIRGSGLFMASRRTPVPMPIQRWSRTSLSHPPTKYQ